MVFKSGKIRRDERTTMDERRKNSRIPINYPVYYICINSNGNVDAQGVGLALDISIDGMMFESDEPIDATTISIQASSSKGDTIKVDGLLIYSMPHSEDRYRSAIRFQGPPDRISYFVAELSRNAL
jgi:hypothetical protein